MYRDLWSPGAADAYRALPPATQDRVDEALAELRADPLRARQVKALKGALRGKYRRRIGDWRLIYTLDHAERVIHVLDLALRRDAY